MRVSELLGAQLDFWVAKAEFGNGRMVDGKSIGPFGTPFAHKGYNPSTDWSMGGPIIDKAGISLKHCDDGSWYAYIDDSTASGTTALEAAMRAYVVLRIGREVPDDNQTQA